MHYISSKKLPGINQSLCTTYPLNNLLETELVSYISSKYPRGNRTLVLHIVEATSWKQNLCITYQLENLLEIELMYYISSKQPPGSRIYVYISAKQPPGTKSEVLHII